MPKDRNSSLNSELVRKYHELLGYSLKGFSVVLRRDINEGMVNNFNSEWLYVWNSNLDISPVFDFYAVITYISDYYMKVIITDEFTYEFTY